MKREVLERMAQDTCISVERLGQVLGLDPEVYLPPELEECVVLYAKTCHKPEKLKLSYAITDLVMDVLANNEKYIHVYEACKNVPKDIPAWALVRERLTVLLIEALEEAKTPESISEIYWNTPEPEYGEFRNHAATRWACAICDYDTAKDAYKKILSNDRSEHGIMLWRIIELAKTPRQAARVHGDTHDGTPLRNKATKKWGEIVLTLLDKASTLDEIQEVYGETSEEIESVQTQVLKKHDAVVREQLETAERLEFVIFEICESAILGSDGEAKSLAKCDELAEKRLSTLTSTKDVAELHKILPTTCKAWDEYAKKMVELGLQEVSECNSIGGLKAILKTADSVSASKTQKLSVTAIKKIAKLWQDRQKAS